MLADLRGKKIGFIPRTTSASFTFRIKNAKGGWDADKDFKIIIGGPVALQAFPLRKDVDAAKWQINKAVDLGIIKKALDKEVFALV